MKNKISYYIQNNGTSNVKYTGQKPISDEKLFKLSRNKTVRNAIKARINQSI